MKMVAEKIIGTLQARHAAGTLRPNDLDKSGTSLMHQAAASGELTCLKWLVKFGGDSSTRTRLGTSPAHFAAGNGHLNVLKFLHEVNSQNISLLDKNNISPLYLAAQEGQLDCLIWLIKTSCIPPDQPETENGMTPVHISAQEGHLECLRYLVKSARVSPSLKDHKGLLPLHYAVAENRYRVITWLVEHCQANVDEGDNEQITPLHVAAKCANDKAVQLLVNCGASLEAKDKNGHTPLDYAQSHRHTFANLKRMTTERHNGGSTKRVRFNDNVDSKTVTPRSHKGVDELQWELIQEFDTWIKSPTVKRKRNEQDLFRGQTSKLVLAHRPDNSQQNRPANSRDNKTEKKIASSGRNKASNAQIDRSDSSANERTNTIYSSVDQHTNKLNPSIRQQNDNFNANVEQRSNNAQYLQSRNNNSDGLRPKKYPAPKAPPAPKMLAGPRVPPRVPTNGEPGSSNVPSRPASRGSDGPIRMQHDTIGPIRPQSRDSDVFAKKLLNKQQTLVSKTKPKASGRPALSPLTGPKEEKPVRGLRSGRPVIGSPKNFRHVDSWGKNAMHGNLPNANSDKLQNENEISSSKMHGNKNLSASNLQSNRTAISANISTEKVDNDHQHNSENNRENFEQKEEKFTKTTRTPPIHRVKTNKGQTSDDKNTGNRYTPHSYFTRQLQEKNNSQKHSLVDNSGRTSRTKYIRDRPPSSLSTSAHGNNKNVSLDLNRLDISPNTARNKAEFYSSNLLDSRKVSTWSTIRDGVSSFFSSIRLRKYNQNQTITLAGRRSSKTPREDIFSRFSIPNSSKREFHDLFNSSADGIYTALTNTAYLNAPIHANAHAERFKTGVLNSSLRGRNKLEEDQTGSTYQSNIVSPNAFIW